jgi:hypothetical protein
MVSMAVVTSGMALQTFETAATTCYARHWLHSLFNVRWNGAMDDIGPTTMQPLNARADVRFQRTVAANSCSKLWRWARDTANKPGLACIRAPLRVSPRRHTVALPTVSGQLHLRISSTFNTAKDAETCLKPSQNLGAEGSKGAFRWPKLQCGTQPREPCHVG